MQSIILTGFMGTGKTTVGKLLASQLQWTFVDVDVKVEEMAGRKIAAIFAQHGEDYFRELETLAIRESLVEKGKVISTGGGALLRNQELLEKGGILVCLTASSGEIIHRLAAEGGRPLLQGDPANKIKNLLEERRHMYNQISIQINTDGKPPEQVASEILEYIGKK